MGAICRPTDGFYHDFRTDANGNLCVSPSAGVTPTHRFLTLAGDGTGSPQITGNYANTVTDFYYLNSATTPFCIQSALLSIADATSMNQSDYGGMVGGVTNGVLILLKAPSGFEIPLYGGTAFKTNQNWHSVTPHVTLSTFPGTPQTLTVAFCVTAAFGAPLSLQPGWSFVFRAHDDFTGLLSQTANIQGTV